jgi:S-adenosylmethionine hydrolase
MLEKSFGHVESLAEPLSIHCGGQEVPGLVSTYAAASPGTLVALLGSSDRLEVAVVQGSAASRLAVDRGEKVTVAATSVNGS